jgi:putative peptidoglycan lipid II flippase
LVTQRSVALTASRSVVSRFAASALSVITSASLAQVGLARATAVGAWINLLLVLGFAVRAGYLAFDRAFVLSLIKFLVTGIVLAAVLWLTARFAVAQFASWGVLRDDAALLLLIVVGAIVYAGSILALFGAGWLRSLVRS